MATHDPGADWRRDSAKTPGKWRVFPVSSDEAKRPIYINGRRALVLSANRLTSEALRRRIGNPFEVPS